MSIPELIVLASAFFCVAALYSSVGHAGASGYLAIMALMGMAPVTMRPTALALNLVVATLATWRFWRAGWTRWSLLWPFIATSVPLAFVGGRVHLPLSGYRALLGFVLVISAMVLAWRAWGGDRHLAEVQPQVPLPVALGAGALIGALSGLTGTGGGIFLSPLLLLAGWAGPRSTAAIAAPFIWANSFAGLLGAQWVTGSLPAGLPWLVAAVLAGAWIGTALGVHRLPPRALLWALSAVMVIAGGKLILTA
jgi:uncharacterized membrane protein YfcA